MGKRWDVCVSWKMRLAGFRLDCRKLIITHAELLVGSASTNITELIEFWVDVRDGIFGAAENVRIKFGFDDNDKPELSENDDHRKELSTTILT